MLVPYARKNHNVSNFNPFHDFDELERAFFSDNALGEFKADIQEDGDNFVLEADLPGFKKEDIHVDVADDRLTVSAERHSNFEDKDKKGNYLRCERSYGSYARSVSCGRKSAPLCTPSSASGLYWPFFRSSSRSQAASIK